MRKWRHASPQSSLISLMLIKRSFVSSAMQRDDEYVDSIDERLKKLVAKTSEMEYRLARILYDHGNEQSD